jgi:hypothetical protein
MILDAFHRGCHPESGIRPTPPSAAPLFPIEIRAHVRAFLAAGLAGEQRLYVGQPDAVRLSVRAQGCPVATMIIGTVDQEAATAGGAPKVIFWRVSSGKRHQSALGVSMSAVWIKRKSPARRPGDSRVSINVIEWFGLKQALLAQSAQKVTLEPRRRPLL